MPAEPRGLAAQAVFIKKGGRGEMTKAPISLQDLRRRLYVKAKAEPTWRFWGLYVHVCKREGSVANSDRAADRFAFNGTRFYAAIPNICSTKRIWPTMSPLGNHLTCPLRIMFMASYPAIVRTAPSTDRNHRLAEMRFFMKR